MAKRPEKIDRSRLPESVNLTQTLVLPLAYTIESSTGGMFPEQVTINYTAVGSWHSEVFKFVSDHGDTVYYDTATEKFDKVRPERCGPKARFALISTAPKKEKTNPADDPKTADMAAAADTYASPEPEDDEI